jgi:hypothetical protein
VDAVETFLIDLYLPAWNKGLRGFGNHLSNKKEVRRQVHIVQNESPWDIYYCHKDEPKYANIRERIEEDLIAKVAESRVAYDRIQLLLKESK